MTNTSELFCAIGEALYGQNWKSELGRRLEFDERQIRLWAWGDYGVPAFVWTRLVTLMDEKQEEIAKLNRWAAKVAWTFKNESSETQN